MDSLNLGGIIEDGCVVLPEYAKLYAVLLRALEQAQNGKGRERHADPGQAFEDQPILSIARMFGGGYLQGQAVKKLHESNRLPKDRAVHEKLGAIVYIAADILLKEEENGLRN